MENFIRTGRIFYGICIAGLAIQQLFYADLRPIIFPAWTASSTEHAIWTCVSSAILFAAAIAIIIEKKAKEAALVLGGIFLALFIFGQVPYEILVDPYSKHFGVWSNALKELALAGGALAVAGSFPIHHKTSEKELPFIGLLEKMVPFSRIFLSVVMILFGIEHFIYPEFVSALVPAWIPGHLFWTYFAGIALIGAGGAIILKIRLREAALLLGVMIFLWLICLHIPRAIADPYGNQGNELTSVFEALGFSGIAFIVAFGYSRK